jgi:hypothetical protein
MSPQEQAHLLAELRRARRGRWLTLHIVLLLALRHSPSEIATFLLCARSTVYGAAYDWQIGRRGQAELTGLPWPCSLSLSVQRSLLALLKKTPAAYGWCRTLCPNMTETPSPPAITDSQRAEKMKQHGKYIEAQWKFPNTRTGSAGAEGR